MSEEVIICMTDFSGHFYTYHFGTFEDFDDRDFDRWICDRMQHECGMIPYDGGRINVNACSRVWYETLEVH